MIKYFLAIIPVFVLLAAAAPGVYASTQGSELGFKQGEFYGDPDRPSEQSNYEGNLACYEAGERDGENRMFDSNSFEDCQMNDGDNPYEDGFDEGCERNNTGQECNIIRLRDG